MVTRFRRGRLDTSFNFSLVSTFMFSGGARIPGRDFSTGERGLKFLDRPAETMTHVIRIDEIPVPAVPIGQGPLEKKTVIRF